MTYKEARRKQCSMSGLGFRLHLVYGLSELFTKNFMGLWALSAVKQEVL